MKLLLQLLIKQFKLINVICGITFVTLVVSSCQLSPQISVEEAEEIKKICSGVTLPPNSIRKQERDIVKPNLANHSIQFTSQYAPRDIKSYFLDQFKDSGWKKENATNIDNLVFRKGKFKIVIEVDNSPEIFSSTRLHALNCSIGVP